MKRSYIRDIKAGDSVLLKGWVYESRILSQMAFILLRDFSGFVQCIVKEKGLVGQISGLTLE